MPRDYHRGADRDHHRGADQRLDAIDASQFSKFRLCGIALGFLFGFLIQITATFALTECVGRNEAFLRSNKILSSVALTAITFLSSCLAFSILRSLIIWTTRIICYHGTPTRSHRLEVLLDFLTYSSFLGWIAGVDVAWIAVDLLFTLRQGAFYLVLSSILSIAVCVGTIAAIRIDDCPSSLNDLEEVSSTDRFLYDCHDGQDKTCAIAVPMDAYVLLYSDAEDDTKQIIINFL